MRGAEDDDRVDATDVRLGRWAAVGLRVFGRRPYDRGSKLVEAGGFVGGWRGEITRVRSCDGLREVRGGHGEGL